MSGLRLIADDLTGALDSAARLVPLVGPIPVFWGAVPDPAPAHFALDGGTRDENENFARAVATRLAPVLAAGDPAFRKLDSLLRGHVAAEIAASAKWFDHVVIAPAFPFQGRITRGGRQFSRDDAGGWRDSGIDLAGALLSAGVVLAPAVAGQAAPAGVSLWDAATDTDLDRIVAAGRALLGRVLWCGTAGLAGALAGRLPVPVPRLPRPILALVGSDQPVAKAQLAVLGRKHHVVNDAAEANAIAGVLERDGVAAVSVSIAARTPRLVAGARITDVFSGLLAGLGFPVGTLFVSGGETLRGLCEKLGATRLDVDGEVLPGVPTAILRGGAWEGQRIVSKSGAFGDAGVLARILG